MTGARDLDDGETTTVKGSGSAVYTLKNTGGAYSCTCPAWLHQGSPAERRTCKHLRAFRGDDAETARVGAPATKPVKSGSSKAGASGDGASGDGAPPLLLAHKWEMDVALEGWWMSEKLDGVRAYWDGARFVSRLGNPFVAPAWFCDGLPKTPLDGELFGGRKRFQRTVGVVKRQDASDAWKELRFVIFDAPSHGGLFEERLAWCKDAVSATQYAEHHPHEPCGGLDHLRAELARVEGLGGEGLMLRKPGSRYEVGRSHTLLKVKTFHDAEAIVVDHVPGAGKHAGRLGALVVEMPDGTRFNVGTGYSDKERESPPALGEIITYRYQELSDGGVPRFPTYVGVRIDAAWTGKKPKKSAPVVSLPSPAPSSSALARYFELVDGKSSKFWEIKLDGSSVTTRYGRIGASGQSTTKDHGSAAAAQAEHDKLVIEKTKKGYAER